MTSSKGEGGSKILLSAPVTDKLPSNDTERLFFYSEVVIANIPSLIADLSSPKYTFLSFSEKTRTEVKQKSALIQSISRTFNNYLSTVRQLQEKQKELEQYERELVSASPPKFMTSTEALEAKKNKDNSQASASTDNGHTNSTIMVLNEEDIKFVRRAEEENAAETAAFKQLSTAADAMEASLAKAHTECEEMTKHVQSLKTEYDDMQHSLQAIQQERSILALVRSEFEGRRGLVQEALSLVQSMEAQCRNEELKLIEGSIEKAEAETDSLRHELLQRKEKHEVELAVYQIASKEAQGEGESLKDDVAFLKRHQKSLEMLAKQQQIEESSQNSLKNLVKRSLTWSSAKAGDSKKPLSQEELANVQADHALVSVLSANVFAMDEQRRNLAGILALVDNVFDNDVVRVTLERIQAVLEPPISLDEDALNL